MKKITTPLLILAFTGLSAYALATFTGSAPAVDSDGRLVANNQATITSDLTPIVKPGVQSETITTALVAGGCFWCVESDLEKTPGVIEAVSGYAGGATENPTYADYGSGGHREVVEVTYDSSKVTFEDLLIVTLKTTDPTDDTGSFADRGDKYSAAFYYETPEQEKIINDLIAEVNENGPFSRPLAIDVEPRPVFWPAEDFHQDYYKGALSSVRYNLYRNASGRNAFIESHWQDTDIHSGDLPWRTGNKTHQAMEQSDAANANDMFWQDYVKPSSDVLRSELSALAFRVTQEDGTERAGTSPYDKLYEPGIYVDILSGQPLFSSRDKYDSRTGWPSFTQPISPEALTFHEDRSLFGLRTEVRSSISDNHLGHVFNDGPRDRGGLRYCMNGVALKFIPETEMAQLGYGDYLKDLYL